MILFTSFFIFDVVDITSYTKQKQDKSLMVHLQILSEVGKKYDSYVHSRQFFHCDKVIRSLVFIELDLDVFIRNTRIKSFSVNKSRRRRGARAGGRGGGRSNCMKADLCVNIVGPTERKQDDFFRASSFVGIC